LGSLDPVSLESAPASVPGAATALEIAVAAAGAPAAGAALDPRALAAGPPPPAAVRLPELEAGATSGGAAVAPGGADPDGLAPRPAIRLTSPGPPSAGLAASDARADEAESDAAPLVAPADSVSAVAAAAPAVLGARPRPGVLAGDLLPARSSFAAGAPARLPEGDGGEGAGTGAPLVADILGPSSPSGRAAAASTARPDDLGQATSLAGSEGSQATPGAASRAPRSAATVGPPVPTGADRRGPPSPLVAAARTETKLPEAPPELQGETDLSKVRSTATRKALVGILGGTQASEDAVFLALRWLSRHQSPDGRWDVDGFDDGCRGCRNPGFQTQCDSAVTALALLAFLGQNHTPLNRESPFRRSAALAISWLLRSQQADGSLAGEDSRYVMYSHGIATLALSEAYALTKDPKLREPVERAVRLILGAQHPRTGGWRYQPKAPLRGDTSITGWQVLALTSARQAGIAVPKRAFDLATHWLDREVASGAHGGIYGYTRPDEPRVAMVAEGMFARLLLGGRRTDRNVEESARYLWSETRAGGHLDNLYLLYYGNLALYHYQGWIWEEWNEEVREFLVRTQHRQGPLAGSWDPAGPWTETGGRVLSTAFATLCLEVYYRYLPLYWDLDKGRE
jgi:hypothetical protein